MATRLSVSLTVILLLSPVFAHLGFAQVDPEKVLVGRWEGQAETAQNRERRLAIKSVKATGSGEWVGYTADDNEITIRSKDNEIYLEWIASGGGKVPYRVKLVGDDKLEGTVGTIERGRPVDRRVTFEKVKAGDVK